MCQVVCEAPVNRKHIYSSSLQVNPSYVVLQKKVCLCLWGLWLLKACIECSCWHSGIISVHSLSSTNFANIWWQLPLAGHRESHSIRHTIFCSLSNQCSPNRLSCIAALIPYGFLSATDALTHVSNTPCNRCSIWCPRWTRLRFYLVKAHYIFDTQVTSV